MQAPKHDESRSVFQVERLSAFSDGVIAICITLLVIEIRAPEIENPTDPALWARLSHMGLKFLGFVISFGIIGHYWSVHHRIFGYVHRYTSTLLWINMVFLFCVVLLPFSSGLLGQYATETDMNIPYLIYALNVCLTGFVNCWLWLYVANPKRNLLTHKISKARIRLGLYRSLVIPIVFAIAIIMSFFVPLAHFFMPAVIPFILHFGMRRLERKANLDEDLHKRQNIADEKTQVQH